MHGQSWAVRVGTVFVLLGLGGAALAGPALNNLVIGATQEPDQLNIWAPRTPRRTFSPCCSLA